MYSNHTLNNDLSAEEQATKDRLIDDLRSGLTDGSIGRFYSRPGDPARKEDKGDDNGVAARFYEEAVRFCKFIVSGTITADRAPELLAHLTRLYRAGLCLPEGWDEDTGEADEDGPLDAYLEMPIHIDMKSVYWEIYYPFEPDEPVCGSLFDDLQDIRSDLARGIAAYQKGRVRDAVFEWKLDFRGHWGFHAVDAIRAIHDIVYG